MSSATSVEPAPGPPSAATDGIGDRGTSEADPPRAASQAEASVFTPLSRRVLIGLGAMFLLATFVQAPGLIEDDTKLPVVMAPYGWIQSVLHLWNQSLYSGSVQEQNFGYLFPMTPFFALTHLLHVPVWCAERIWLALLLTAGCWGVIRLAEALGIGKPWARVLGGVAYAVTPIVSTWASRSGALLAVMLLPWMLQPLVAGSRRGSPRRAAAKSGLAVALMGGVNATVILATLPVGVLWLLTRGPGPRRRSLTGWWIVSVGLACFWWVIPTLLVSKYGYNYLPYTETSSITTSTTPVVEALRGTSYWVDYFAIGGPLLPGAWTLVTSAGAIMGTTVATAMGLAGLTRRIPERLFLVATLCLGVVVISIGYGGALAGPFSTHVQLLLQGSLGPLRSVSKFSPDVSLPLALGLIWLVSGASLPSVKRRLARWPRLMAANRRLLGVVAVVAVILAATPIWKQQLYPAGGFSAMPGYWTQTSNWLGAHQGNQTALLVPGAPFAQYTWGSPTDEPLQVLSPKSVTARSLIPLGSNGQTVMLTAIDSALREGYSPAGLAEYLSRSGVAYVVERNDLDLARSNAPPPAQVHQVLTETPGLVRVASFGPYQPRAQVTHGGLNVYDSPDALRLRAVEIFKVFPAVSEVQTYPARDPLIVSGSSDSLLPLAGSGVLAGRAAVLAGDSHAAAASSAPGKTWVITNGNQRRVVSFGAIANNLSYLLGPNEIPVWETAGIPLGFGVVSGRGAQTVAAPIGARSVSASSFGSTPLFDEPTEGPAAAFDGDPQTAWVATASHNSVGEWVAINFDHPTAVKAISISPLVDSDRRPTISRVTVTTARGSVSRNLPSGSGPFDVTVAPGATSYLRVTIDQVRRALLPPFLGPLGVGISEITVPGVSFQPAVQLPTNEVAAFSTAGASSAAVNVFSPISNVNLNLNLLNPSDSPEPPVTQVTIPKAMSAGLTGTAVPTPSVLLEEAIAFIGTPVNRRLDISATSWLGGLPRFRATNLIQGSTHPWIAGLSDADPSLTLHWLGRRPIASLVIRTTAQASAPGEVIVSDKVDRRVTRTVAIPPGGGTVTFDPITTDSLVLRFSQIAHRVTTVPSDGIPIPLPVGLASVEVPAVDGGQIATAKPTSTAISVCGIGPTVRVDGSDVKTEVHATLGELLSLKAVPFTSCSPGNVSLVAGNHVVSFPPGDAFRVTSLTAQTSNPSRPAVVSSQPRKARVVTWSAAKRTLALTAGQATIVQVSQNFNVGWVARFGGQKLTPVRLGGWEQGWIVPAGAAGTMSLAFAPDGLYRGALFLGALFLVALAVLAVRSGRRAELPALEPRRRLKGPVLAVCAGLIVVAVGGWLAVALLPLIAAAYRWGSEFLSIVAGVAFTAAGVVIAWHPSDLISLNQGAFSAAAQVLSVVALCAVLSALVVEERRGHVRHRSAEDSEASPA